MQSPTINELPKPPVGKTGWPWTEETEQLPEKMPDGSDWPKISIVTPSYNQGQYIEETIRSVVLQGYPNLEYIIIDGGSKDKSVQIIKKYDHYISYWISKPDKGQANAINIGLELASGDIVAYINSDDFYLPGALFHVANVYKKNKFDIFIGNRKYNWSYRYLFSKSKLIGRFRPYVYPALIFSKKYSYNIPQECTFWDHQNNRDIYLPKLFINYLANSINSQIIHYIFKT